MDNQIALFHETINIMSDQIKSIDTRMSSVEVKVDTGISDLRKELSEVQRGQSHLEGKLESSEAVLLTAIRSPVAPLYPKPNGDGKDTLSNLGGKIVLAALGLLTSALGIIAYLAMH